MNADAARSGVPRIVIVLVAVAIVMTVAAVATGLVLASRLADETPSSSGGPLAVPAAPAPGAEGRYCAQLMAALPDAVADLPQRDLIAGSAGVAAWGDPAVILRCGLSDPAELTCAAPLTTFTGADGVAVQWLRIAASGSVTYLAVDRPVRVAVTVPDSAGIGPVQDISDVIGKTLPGRAVCSAGGVTPADNS